MAVEEQQPFTKSFSDLISEYKKHKREVIENIHFDKGAKTRHFGN